MTKERMEEEKRYLATMTIAQKAKTIRDCGTQTNGLCAIF